MTVIQDTLGTKVIISKRGNPAKFVAVEVRSEESLAGLYFMGTP